MLCVDEKSQIQALDRTVPILTMQEGRIERRLHDYYRRGTTTLFAALDIVTGEVTAALRPKHRHQEFLAFLKQIERTYREVLDADGRPVELHLVMGNYAAHKHKNLRAWLAKHPRSTCTSPRPTPPGEATARIGDFSSPDRAADPPTLSVEYESFRGSLGIGVHLCRPRDPDAKGLTERNNGYFETSFLPCREFTGQHDFNTQICELLTRANGRHSRRIGCAPTARWTTDRDAMLRLSRRRPRSGGVPGSGCRVITTCGWHPTTTPSTPRWSAGSSTWSRTSRT